MPSARSPFALMSDDPSAAVTSAPGQSVECADDATTSPGDSLSVNDQPSLAPSSSVFVTVKVSLLVLPSVTDSGLKLLATDGVASRILMLSNAASFPEPLPFALTIRMPTAEPENKIAAGAGKTPALELPMSFARGSVHGLMGSPPTGMFVVPSSRLYLNSGAQAIRQLAAAAR